MYTTEKSERERIDTDCTCRMKAVYIMKRDYNKLLNSSN